MQCINAVFRPTFPKPGAYAQSQLRQKITEDSVVQLFIKGEPCKHAGNKRVLNFLGLRCIGLGCKRLRLGVSGKQAPGVPAIVHHISAPVGGLLCGPAFRKAAQKRNELADDGKMALFDRGNALHDTAYGPAIVADGPRLK